jgi:hypothetical protein
MVVPVDNPVKIPVDQSITPTAILLLDQVPTVDKSLKVSELPTHTTIEPVIGAGNGLTVIEVVVKQPVGNW